MDARAATFDDARPHPVIDEINDYLRGLDWVADAGSDGCGTRDTSSTRRPLSCRRSGRLDLDAVEAARAGCAELDWRLQDVVLVPVRELPRDIL